MRVLWAIAVVITPVVFCALAVVITPVVFGALPVAASPESDRKQVAKLDTEFQAAVKRNDAATMARILHEDMVLILGDGRVNTREEQLQEARDKLITYEIQDEDPGTQTVRVHGNVAIVTALLRVKGTTGAKPFDRRLWFSDIYVHTPAGWRYFFGQASLHLPDSPHSP
jgi:ketosteroid isomerase-like protein